MRGIYIFSSISLLILFAGACSSSSSSVTDSLSDNSMSSSADSVIIVRYKGGEWDRYSDTLKIAKNTATLNSLVIEDPMQLSVIYGFISLDTTFIRQKDSVHVFHTLNTCFDTKNYYRIKIYFTGKHCSLTVSEVYCPESNSDPVYAFFNLMRLLSTWS